MFNDIHDIEFTKDYFNIRNVLGSDYYTTIEIVEKLSKVKTVNTNICAKIIKFCKIKTAKEQSKKVVSMLKNVFHVSTTIIKFESTTKRVFSISTHDFDLKMTNFHLIKEMTYLFDLE